MRVRSVISDKQTVNNVHTLRHYRVLLSEGMHLIFTEAWMKAIYTHTHIHKDQSTFTTNKPTHNMFSERQVKGRYLVFGFFGGRFIFDDLTSEVITHIHTSEGRTGVME